MPTEIRCPSCGATMPASGACAYCRSAVAVDGVVGRLVPGTARCPRCPDTPSLQGFVHGEVTAEACMACHGVWFSTGGLERALRAAAAAAPGRAEGRQGPAHGAVEPVRYARCPVCAGGMTRHALGRRPLVIIDRCPAHGDWCDGGELGQLKALARTRGVDALFERAPARQVKPPAEGPESLIAGLRANVGREGIFTPEVEAAGDFRQGRGRRRARGRGPDIFDALAALFKAVLR